MLRGAVLLALACAAVGVEGPLIELPVPDPVAQPRAEAAPPAAPAPARAIIFTWDNYRTLVVVGEGIGRIRPAWVVTSDVSLLQDHSAGLIGPVFGLFGYHDLLVPIEKLAVAYRAQAWLDAQGRMQIVAKQAVLVGPQANEWSPDSFQVTFPDRVETIDDEARANRGTIEEMVDPARAPDRYRTLQTKAQVIVGDGI